MLFTTDTTTTATCVSKLDEPSAIILFNTLNFGIKLSFSILKFLTLPKYAAYIIKLRNWPIIVAYAAPAIPSFNVKIATGSPIMLKIAPASIPTIA